MSASPSGKGVGDEFGKEVKKTDSPSSSSTGRVDEAGSSGGSVPKKKKRFNIPMKLKKLSNDSFERILEKFARTSVALENILPDSTEDDESSPTVSASSLNGDQNIDSRSAKLLVSKLKQQHVVIDMTSEDTDQDDGEIIAMQDISPATDGDTDAKKVVSQDTNLYDTDTLGNPKEDGPSAGVNDDAVVAGQDKDPRKDIPLAGVNDDDNSDESGGTSLDKSTQTDPMQNPAPDASPEEGQSVEAEQEGGEMAENRNGNQAVVSLDLTEDDYATSTTPTGHLESYLVLTNYLGISTYRREEYGALKKEWSVVLKVVYYTITTAALLQMLRLVKVEALYAALDTDLKSCVLFWNDFVHFLSRCFFVYLFACCVTKISAMLLHLRQIKRFRTDHESSSLSFSRIATSMAVVSITLTILTTMYGYNGFNEWSIKESIQYRSYQMSHDLCVWSITNYDNATDAIFEENFAESLTAKQTFWAATDGFLDFCGTLQGEFIVDLLVLAAVMLLSGWKSFEKRIESQILLHPNNCDPAEVEMAVRQYKAMRQANMSVNETLSVVLIFVIIQSLFLFGNIFVQILDLKKSQSEVNMKIIQSAVDASKAFAMFCISLQINWRHGTVTKWLRMMTKYNGPVDVEGILGMSIQAALDDLRENPVGFGSDYFLINQAFLVWFFAAVTSIIGLLAETENQQNVNDQLLRMYI